MKSLNDKKSQAKQNGFSVFIKVFFGIILSILVLIFAALISFCIFSAKDKASAFNRIPSDYSAYFHTDNFYRDFNPLVDLKLTKTILISPEFNQFYDDFYKFKNSKLRKNFFVKNLLSRKIDVALYTDCNGQMDFLIQADLDFVSAITRLIPFAMNYIEKKNLSSNLECIKSDGRSENYFIFKTESYDFYIKCEKNLFVVCSSSELFEKAFCQENDIFYSDELKFKLLNNKKNYLKLNVNGKKIVSDFNIQNDFADEFFKAIDNFFGEDFYISLNNSKASLQVNIPLTEISNLIFEENLNSEQINAESNIEESSFRKLFYKESQDCSLIKKIPENLLMTGIINAGNLEEIKAAVWPVLSKSNDTDGLWKTAENFCKSVLHISVEDLLFSWTGSEIGIFKLAENEDPVIAVEVVNEEMRKIVFEKIFSSILMNKKSGTTVNDINFGRFEMPAIFRKILKLFKLEIPKPYYYVSKDFVFFCENVDNLYKIFSSDENASFNKMLGVESKIDKIEEKIFTAYFSYDLNKEIPHFVKDESLLKEVIQLYKNVECEIYSSGNTVSISVNAACK